MGKKTTSSIDTRMRKAAVTAADLKTAIMAVNDLPEEDRRDLTARSIVVMKAFGLLRRCDGGVHEVSEEERSLIDKITAVQIRIEAMASLCNDKRFLAT